MSDETLQTGQNPISVSENALPISPVVAGVFFNDSHGRSYVLVEDTGQEEPDPSECPPTETPELSLLSAPCVGLDDTPRIRILGLILGLQLVLNGQPVDPEDIDGDGFVDVPVGLLTWSVLDEEDEEIASGELLVQACPTSSSPSGGEGSEAGGVSSPAGSLSDTATSVGSFGGPVATLVFGLILLGSLGALAYANVSAVRRRS